MKYLLLMITIVLFSCKEKSSSRLQDNAGQQAIDTTLKWIDYQIGELPPVGYYDAFDSIIRKWNIRYERIQGGCEPGTKEEKEYEKGNTGYFRVLEKKYGKDWRQRFNTEVHALDSLMHAKPATNR